MTTENAEIQEMSTIPIAELQAETIMDETPVETEVQDPVAEGNTPNVRECNLDSVMKELRDYMNIVNTEEESQELTESVLTALAVYDDFQVPQLIRTKVKEANEALIRNRILGVNVDAIVQQVSRAYSTITPISESDTAAFSSLANYLIQVMDGELKLGPTKIKNLLFLSMFVGNKK